MATTGIAAPQTAQVSNGAYYDPAKLAAAMQGQGAGADGRTVLGNDAWMQILNSINGVTLSQAADPGHLVSGGDSQDPFMSQATQAIYKDAQGRSYRQVGTDPASGQPLIQYTDNSGGGWQNPTGNSGDRVQPTYKLDAQGNATPVSSGAEYKPSTWVSSGRDAAKILGTVLAAGGAGAALGGTGGFGTGAATTGGSSLPTFAGNAAGTSLGGAGGGGGIAGNVGAQVAAAQGAGAAGAAGGGMSSADLAALYGGSGYGATGGELAAGATGGGGLLGSGVSAGQAASGVGTAGSLAGAGGGDVANTGSDAHLYQNQAGGTGVQDLANMGGAGTGTMSTWNGGSGSYGDLLTQLMKGGVGQGLAGLGAAGVGALLNKGGDLNVPNYTAAAQSQAASGRTDQSNPWGSLTYSQNGVDAQGNPIYKQNVSLNPADQANLDQARAGQSSALTGLNNSINGYADAVKGLPGLYGDAGSQSALTQQAIDSMYHQQSALLDPQYQQQQAALSSQLANQGVVQGSQAYNQAMDSFARQRDYAYGNARDSSISQGNALANQLFNQNLQAHTTGMNDLSTQQNQFLTDANGLGNTVKQPTFATPPATTNYLGAAALQGQGNLNQYNAKIGNTNSLNNGLFGLAGSVLSNPTWTNAIGNLFSTGGGG